MKRRLTAGLPDLPPFSSMTAGVLSANAEGSLSPFGAAPGAWSSCGFQSGR